MSPKSSRPAKSQAASPARRVAPPEERSAEAATIAWMLAAVATLAAQLVAVAARLGARGADAEDAAPIVRILPGWFLICAVLTGLLCLLLTPVVYRLRRTAPPWPVTAGAILISLSPLVILAVFLL